MRTSKQALENPRHGLCVYHVGELYCPLPGTLSPDASNAPTSQWYCWMHIEDRPQGAAARADLEHVISDQSQLRTKRQATRHLGLLWDAAEQKYTYDVERSTIAGRPGTMEERMQASLAAHPEWYRGADEAKRDYQARMMVGLKQAGVVKPLPYDPDARLAADEAAEERAAIQGELG